MSILSSVALGWFRRRILDWGGVFGGFLWFILKLYSELPPELQAAVGQVLQGHWAELSLGSAAGLIAWAWSQRGSWLATTKPQVVTVDGKKIEDLPATLQADIEATAAAAPKRTKTIGSLVLDGLLDKLNRNRNRNR